MCQDLGGLIHELCLLSKSYKAINDNTVGFSVHSAEKSQKSPKVSLSGNSSCYHHLLLCLLQVA